MLQFASRYKNSTHMIDIKEKHGFHLKNKTWLYPRKAKNTFVSKGPIYKEHFGPKCAFPEAFQEE